MNRSEHLQWSKDRAIEYVDDNNLGEAFASFMSDMGKHSETRNHLALELGMTLLFSGNLSTSDKMRSWISGFN